MKISFKKWFIFTLTGFSVLALLYLFLVYFCYRSFNGDIIWIRNCCAVKENIVRNLQGNKIIFLGGSATLFGIRTEDVQKKLGVPCVNLGVHAGLEIDYMVFWVKKILKSGDVVICSMEYPYFLYDGVIRNITLEYAFTYDRAFIRSMSLTEKIKNAARISPPKLAISFAKWLLGKNRQEAKQGYNSASLNENGDETSNVGRRETDRRLRFARPMEIMRGRFQETAGLRIIKDFYSWCKINNIVLYVTFANTLYFEDYDSAPYRDYFLNLENYLREHDIARIGAPADFFFPREFFYDTQYHLNSAGVTIRTGQLIEMMNNLNIGRNLRNRELAVEGNGSRTRSAPGSRP